MNKNDKSFWSYVLIDSYFAFVLFTIFATIIIMHVIFNLELENNANNFYSQLKGYIGDNVINKFVNNDYFKSALNYINSKKHETETNIKSDNDNLNNNLIIICVVYIIGIIIIFITVLYYLGFNFWNIDWKYILIIISINIVLILLYELLFVYLGIGKYNIVKINNIIKLLTGVAVN